MEFHQRALDLFGTPDHPLDPTRRAATARSAAALGVALPRAVVEWYSVPERSELWGCYHGDGPAVWEPPGSLRAFHRGDGPPPVGERVWWVNPPVVADRGGWFRSPVLPLRTECQGRCWWGVVLDGSDDPPAVKSAEDVGNVWYPHAATFSDFVWAEVFDYRTHDPAGWWGRARVGECLRDKHLVALRNEFAAGPSTADSRGELTMRFSRDGQRFRVENYYPFGFSVWTAWAADEAAFAELAGRLGRVDRGLSGLSPAERQPRLATGAPPVVRGDDEIPF